MNIQDAYAQFITGFNSLATNVGQNIHYDQFVILLNKAQLHWAEVRIKVAEGQLIRVDELEQLLKDHTVMASGKKENFYEVPLPNDYFHRSRLYATVDGCDGIVYGKFVEEGNLNVLLQGAFTAPSAEWEETLVTIFNKKLRVYFKDFLLDKVYLKYYRLPIPADIAGYTRLDGSPSVNVDLEFNGVNAQEILDMTVQLASGATLDTTRYQVISKHIQENN